MTPTPSLKDAVVISLNTLQNTPNPTEPYKDLLADQIIDLVISKVLDLVGSVPEDMDNYSGEARGMFIERQALTSAIKGLKG